MSLSQICCLFPTFAACAAESLVRSGSSGASPVNGLRHTGQLFLSCSHLHAVSVSHRHCIADYAFVMPSHNHIQHVTFSCTAAKGRQEQNSLQCSLESQADQQIPRNGLILRHQALTLRCILRKTCGHRARIVALAAAWFHHLSCTHTQSTGETSYGMVKSLTSSMQDKEKGQVLQLCALRPSKFPDRPGVHVSVSKACIVS